MKSNKRSINHGPGRTRSGLGFLCLILVAFVGGLGLTHILVKNKTHALGGQQRVVEREIAVIEEDMRNLNMKIEEALSRKNLTESLIARRSKLKAILPDNIVRIPVSED